MNEDYHRYTRMNRHKKKRNNSRTTILVIILSIVFIVLLITLLSIITSGKKDKTSHDTMNNSDQNELIEVQQNDDQLVEDALNGQQDNSNNDKMDEETESPSNSNSEPLEDLEIIEESNDENVIRTYIGNWEPIGTVQTGEHVTNFNDGSLDRIEIEKASSKVTGISANDMFVGWVGNDGPQKVFTIISDQDRKDFFKLYLSWIDQEGWQVTKVEKIREFDIDKYRK